MSGDVKQGKSSMFVSVYIILLYTLSFVIIGMAIDRTIDLHYNHNNIYVQSYTPSIGSIIPGQDRPFRVKVPEISIVLHFESSDHFYKHIPARYAGMTVEGTGIKPCNIYMLDGFILNGNSEDTSSDDENFDDYGVTQILAHELLHCILGGWHPPD